MAELVKETEKKIVKIMLEGDSNKATEVSEEKPKRKIKIRNPLETDFYQQLCLANARIGIFKNALVHPQSFGIPKQEWFHHKVHKRKTIASGSKARTNMAVSNVTDIHNNVIFTNLHVGSQTSFAAASEPAQPSEPQPQPTEAPQAAVSELYAVEIGEKVFMPSKLTNRTDRASMTHKFSLIEAIRQKQLAQMKKPPSITKSDRKSILRPYTYKPNYPTLFYAIPPQCTESLTENDRNNLLRSFRVANGRREEQSEHTQARKLDIIQKDWNQCCKEECPSKEHKYAIANFVVTKEPRTVRMVDSLGRELAEAHKNQPNRDLADYLVKF